ncbi:4Fe-4S binding protein [bacterium]|nr:4Fe-4S binding protein [bacterium]
MPASRTSARPAGPANMLGVLDKLTGPDVKVYQGRCVRVRNRNVVCTRCADACTTGAISTDEQGRVVVMPSRCIGCGTCATVCPTCALEAHHPTDEDLLASALAATRANDGHVVVACAKVLDEAFGRCDESRVVRVTCLGRVDESLLAALAAAGAADVSLVEGACADCPHATGWSACRAVTESCERILAAWGRALPIVYVDALPAQVMTLDGFGAPAAGQPAADPMAAPDDPADPDGDLAPRFVADGSQVTAAGERFAKVGRDGTLPHFVPTRRGRLLQTLAELGAAPDREPVATRLWGEVVIDTQACGSCRLCAVFCPTGALRAFDDRRTATFGIEHEPGACVACGTCVDVCPKQAVTLTDEVFPSDLYDGHVERFEMRPREVEPGRPDTIVKKMRGVLSASKYVSQA